MKKFLSALALAAAVVASPALATTTPWYTHDAMELGAGGSMMPGGSFLDTFTFTITSPSKLNALAAEINLFGFDVTSGKVELFNSSNVSQGWFTFSGSSGMLGSFGPLAVGSYYYAVSGVAGATGGMYNITSTLAPVPEPASIAMMLAGLGALGVVRRRRQA